MTTPQARGLRTVTRPFVLFDGWGSFRPDAHPLMRLEAAARRLGVSMTTIRRLIGRGELLAVRVGRVYRMDPRDLERFVEEHKE